MLLSCLTFKRIGALVYHSYLVPSYLFYIPHLLTSAEMDEWSLPYPHPTAWIIKLPKAMLCNHVTYIQLP